ncbi:MAG: hypothetical protein J0M16_05345 [Gammaproteobacteria bacterium]|nr:hypothetical protein [Gammaproteobacteria bacterium]
MELLVVVLIMGILTMASVAGYRGYVQRANRVDATGALLRISAGQERFFLQNNRYATTAEELADPPPAGLGITGSERGYYELGVAAADGGAATGYTATATATSDGPQRDDECQTFTIDQGGFRGAGDADGNTGAEVTDRCWR